MVVMLGTTGLGIGLGCGAAGFGFVTGGVGGGQAHSLFVEHVRCLLVCGFHSRPALLAC